MLACEIHLLLSFLIKYCLYIKKNCKIKLLLYLELKRINCVKLVIVLGTQNFLKHCACAAYFATCAAQLYSQTVTAKVLISKE